MAIKRSTVDLIIKTGAAVADTVAVAGAAAVGISSSGGLSTPGAISRGNVATRPTSHQPTPPPPPSPPPFGLSGTPRGSRAKSSLDANYRPHYRAPLPTAPKQRMSLTRSEVALCLLSEIACERDEELRPHLSLLLHLAVLNIDSPNPLVRHEARQMLLYLLYSLAYKPLEGQATAAGPSLPPPEYARVAGMIGYLQALPTEGNDPLWSWELPTLAEPWVPSAGYVAVFVQLVVNCFTLDGSLKERWSATALEWACCAASRHAASRSHQVFCALSPRLSSTSCTALLAALHKCLASATPEGLDTAVEILCTLRVLLTNTPPTKLVLYPHLFVACIALLCSSVVRIGELATAMLIQLLDALDLSATPHVAGHAILSVLSVPKVNEPVTSDVSGVKHKNGFLTSNGWVLGERLLSGAPGLMDGDVEEEDGGGGVGGPWLALQQLLIKGLFQPDTLPLALRGMGAIARQVSRAGTIFLNERTTKAGAVEGTGSGSGNGDRYSLGVARQVHAVFGTAEVGLVLSIAAVLPWLFVHCDVHGDEYVMSADYGYDDEAMGLALGGFLADTAAACLAVGWDGLAAACAVLSSKTTPLCSIELRTSSWLQDFVEMFTEVTFPVYARLTVQRLIEVVERGEERYQYAALKILSTLFRVPSIRLGSLTWFTNGSRLLDVISMSVSLEGALGEQALDVLAAMASHRTVAGDSEEGEAGGPLEWARCMDDMGESNNVCAEALRRVVESSPGSAELVKAVGGGGAPNDRRVYGGVSSVHSDTSGNAANANANEDTNMNLKMNLNSSGGGVPASDALLPFLPGPELR